MGHRAGCALAERQVIGGEANNGLQDQHWLSRVKPCQLTEPCDWIRDGLNGRGMDKLRWLRAGVVDPDGPEWARGGRLASAMGGGGVVRMVMLTEDTDGEERRDGVPNEDLEDDEREGLSSSSEKRLTMGRGSQGSNEDPGWDQQQNECGDCRRQQTKFLPKERKIAKDESGGGFYSPADGMAE